MGVLDQVLLFDGEAQSAAQATLAQAVHAESAGYHRFWIAEHHGKTSGCGSPEILSAVVAAKTNSIRVGPGAILLPYYTPVKVAESMTLLERLFPTRIDLAIGRGPGAELSTQELLQPGYLLPYEEKLESLLYHLDNSEYHFALAESDIDVWVVGSSASSARLAARLGTSFCFASFINPDETARAIGIYRDTFVPRDGIRNPIVGIALRVMCGENSSDIDALANLASYTPRGKHSLLPSWGELRGIGKSNRSQSLTAVIGFPSQVEDKLLNEVDKYQPDDLFIATASPDASLRNMTLDVCISAIDR